MMIAIVTEKMTGTGIVTEEMTEEMTETGILTEETTEETTDGMTEEMIEIVTDGTTEGITVPFGLEAITQMVILADVKRSK